MGNLRGYQMAGLRWAKVCFASDYFGQLFDWACKLIMSGDAYVDELSFDEMRAYRALSMSRQKQSPPRPPATESLDLFKRMRSGEFEDGAKVLRAKIDMAHPNMNMRDPYASSECTTTGWATHGQFIRVTISPMAKATQSRRHHSLLARI